MKLNLKLALAISSFLSAVSVADVYAYAAEISFISRNSIVEYQRGDRQKFCRKDNKIEPPNLDKCPVSLKFNKFSGGRLYIGKNSFIKILCASGKEESVSSTNIEGKPFNKICPQEPNIPLGDSAEIGRGTMTNSTSKIPYIISPRYSLILDEKPEFRWNFVPDAKSYTVELFYGQDKKAVCKGEKIIPLLVLNKIASVDFNRVCNTYRLRENSSYRLVVTADNGRSSEDEGINLNDYNVEDRGVSGVRFRLINSDRLLKPSKPLLENIDHEPISLSMKSYRKSLVFSQNYLYAEAISQLERAITIEPLDIDINIDIHLALGDLYADRGLLFQAREIYSKIRPKIYQIPNSNNLKFIYEQNINKRLRSIERRMGL